MAAPTTSLPELLGGERNWDYRYTWIRDAAFSLYGLLRLGFTEEAEAFSGWLTERFRECRGDETGPLQIMYGIDGRSDLEEEVLGHLEGYRGSAPVRIGNGAADQLQLDIYGELLDSVYLFNKYGRPIYHEGWEALQRIVDWLCENWDQPDEGIWEVRGGQHDFVYSRLMCWVAIERAIRVARQRGLPADLVRWLQARDADVRPDHGARLEREARRVRPALRDGRTSTPRFCSCRSSSSSRRPIPAGSRPSTRSPTSSSSDSLVYRYNVGASPDGLRGEEGTFSMCSFWYVEALARAGRLDDARLAFEKMLTYANHSASTRRRSARAASSSGTSRKPSPTSL